MNLSPMVREFLAVEDVIQHARAQRESVKGLDTPFRVEFRYRGGTKHWQYFVTHQDAEKAIDRRASYSPFGRASIEFPNSQQIQVRGPRGGWSAEKDGEQEGRG